MIVFFSAIRINGCHTSILYKIVIVIPYICDPNEKINDKKT